MSERRAIVPIAPPGVRPGRDFRQMPYPCQRGLAPRVERGFHAACMDLKPTRKLVIWPGEDRHRLAEDIEVVNPRAAASLLAHSGAQ